MKKNKKPLLFLVVGMMSLGIFSGCGSDDATQENTSEIVTEATSETISAPTINTSTENLPELNDELKGKIEAIGKSCESFYNKTKDDKEFFSWAGFLAYYDEKEYEVSRTPNEVTVSKLKELGYVSDENAVDNVIILYAKPQDIDSTYKKTTLDIFTAISTKDGYYVYGSGYGNKVIPFDDFRNIIMKYNIDNGQITNPATGSDDYNALMEAIKTFRNDSSVSYVTRYVEKNDLYAVVILSGTDDVTDTTEYLLKKQDGNWLVVKNALENIENVRAELNAEYTDFDLNILPPYTLYVYRKQVRTTEHYKEIFDMLIQQKIIDANDEITYCCGTQHVLYAEFASGKKLAGGATKEGAFTYQFVNSYEEAVAELSHFVEPVPAFILKYNK